MDHSPPLVVLLVVLLTVSITASGIVSSISVAHTGQSDLPKQDDRSNEVTMISDCQEITSPGHYQLEADIINSTENVCIRVLASDVIIDGAGHRIDGVDKYIFRHEKGGNPTSTKALVVNGNPSLTNVTVKNIEATDYGYGIWWARTSNGRLINNTFRSNGIYGAYLGYDAKNNIVADNRVRNIRSENHSGKGIVLANHAPGNVVIDNDVRSTESSGISALEANRTRIEDNRIEDAGSVGIILGGSSHSVVRDNTVDGAKTGIRIGFTANATIAGNVVTNVREFGVSAREDVRETEIRSNEISGGRVGIRLVENERNRLINNTVTGSVIGIKMGGTGAQTLLNTTVKNTEDGINARRVLAPFSVENAVLGANVRVSVTGQNVSISGTRQSPSQLPERTHAVTNHLQIKPRPANSWLEIAIHFDASTVAAEASINLWMYSGEWTKLPPSAVNQHQNRLSTNLTDIMDGIHLVVAQTEPATPTPSSTATPSPTPTTSPTAEPSQSPTSTTSPTAGPGQPGFGVLTTLIGLLGAMLLARRYHGPSM